MRSVGTSRGSQQPVAVLACDQMQSIHILRNDSDTFDQSLQFGDRPMRRVRLCCTHQAAAPFLPALSVFDRAEC
jgi:hypothetical protein